MNVLDLNQMEDVNGGRWWRPKPKSNAERASDSSKSQYNESLPKEVTSPAECAKVYPHGHQPLNKQNIHYRVCVGETSALGKHSVVQDTDTNKGNNGFQ